MPDQLDCVNLSHDAQVCLRHLHRLRFHAEPIHVVFGQTVARGRGKSQSQDGIVL